MNEAEKSEEEKDPVYKCGYRKCNFMSETRGPLFEHLEAKHGLKRKAQK